MLPNHGLDAHSASTTSLLTASLTTAAFLYFCCGQTAFRLLLRSIRGDFNPVERELLQSPLGLQPRSLYFPSSSRACWQGLPWLPQRLPAPVWRLGGFLEHPQRQCCCVLPSFCPTPTSLPCRPLGSFQSPLFPPPYSLLAASLLDYSQPISCITLNTAKLRPCIMSMSKLQDCTQEALRSFASCLTYFPPWLCRLTISLHFTYMDSFTIYIIIGTMYFYVIGLLNNQTKDMWGNVLPQPWRQSMPLPPTSDRWVHAYLSACAQNWAV